MRPVYAGNAIAKVQSTDGVKVLTVRTTAFEKAASSSNSAPTQSLSAASSSSGAQWISDEITKSVRPELGSSVSFFLF